MNINLKNIKKNQVIIFVIALMLVSAGYLNYSANNNTNTVETNAGINSIEEIAQLGDATLVNSNALVDNTNTNTIVETNTKVVDDYFSSTKLNRDTMYSQMLESYEEILANENIPADQKTIAQNEIKNINDTRNRIMICENLINTKGIKDCIILVNDDNINVVIKEELKQDQIAQIQNIISREMKVDVDKIHISNKY